ncbi:pantoate--beta-alanine ligase [Bacillus sp. 1NLA3E]|uniref:pantoate--beta-alanine ligase n=1 Tax=Bacillus sp. 1NLA3E TaxID=666686 RepID=UPI000247E2F4|nr:pantoate--beta-alanine ligase [Bacillus sp. 1NLA3E]AGK54680.1 pantoate--beta-alanine ligase [Bacillus sp. 1NLA3E]
MKIYTKIDELQSEILKQKSTGKSIGFVPTMGYLHEGHASLMQTARTENDLVVVSIFVNPLQFGPKEDLASYPRDFERDQQVAVNNKVDYVFYPEVKEMYPNEPAVTVTVKDRTDVLCGKSRPGHFDGVATVLTKLFHITLPDRVYFGMKDAQQVAVIDSLINDFNFPIEIVPVQTVREEDGLAKSSRNINLLPDEREQAPKIYQGLKQAELAIRAGEKEPSKIISLVKSFLNANIEGTIDYLELYSYPNLKAIDQIKGKIIIAVAVKFNKVRLIDNLIIELN